MNSVLFNIRQAIDGGDRQRIDIVGNPQVEHRKHGRCERKLHCDARALAESGVYREPAPQLVRVNLGSLDAYYLQLLEFP